MNDEDAVPLSGRGVFFAETVDFSRSLCYTIQVRTQGGYFTMSLALKIVLLIASIILTVSILLQSSNSAGLSGSIGGGAEQLFGKKRSSGYDAILSKISTVTAILFILISLVLVAIE